MVNPFARSATRQIARGAVACDCTRAVAPGADAAATAAASASSRRVSTRKDSEAGLCHFPVARLRRRARGRRFAPASVLGHSTNAAAKPPRKESVGPLLILSRSNAKTSEAWSLARLRLKTSRSRALPIFACSQPILVETRSVCDLIRGSLTEWMLANDHVVAFRSRRNQIDRHFANLLDSTEVTASGFRQLGKAL